MIPQVEDEKKPIHCHENDLRGLPLEKKVRPTIVENIVMVNTRRTNDQENFTVNVTIDEKIL
uniref:Uncharacterized protein n=1 Tax=Romanomermis culicivorax TaxID=13658 RepID=A0A915K0E8_ROMCU